MVSVASGWSSWSLPMSWSTAPATTSPWFSGGFMSGYLAAYFSAR